MSSLQKGILTRVHDRAEEKAGLLAVLFINNGSSGKAVLEEPSDGVDGVRFRTQRQELLDHEVPRWRRALSCKASLASGQEEDSHAAAFRKHAEIVPIIAHDRGTGDAMVKEKTNTSKDIVFGSDGDEVRHHDVLGKR